MDMADMATVPNAVEAAKSRRAGLHHAMVELERAIAAAAPGREDAWRDQVGVTLDRVAAAFETHITATEGPEGLFDQIRRRAPRLDGRCRRLTRDHRVIVDELDAARAAMADEVAETREAVLSLLAHLARHRQHGADLVYEAYDVDLGGSD